MRRGLLLLRILPLPLFLAGCPDRADPTTTPTTTAPTTTAPTTTAPTTTAPTTKLPAFTVDAGPNLFDKPCGEPEATRCKP